MEEKKKKNRTSAKAVAKYQKKAYDKTLIRLKKGELDKVRARADELGKSLNGYICDLIREDLNKN